MAQQAAISSGMLAKELMTTQIVSVGPDTPAAEIARTLMAHGISAVPVVDDAGVPVGMVSEGDLIGRSDAERDARRDWWLGLLAEGEEPSVESLGAMRATAHTARELMAAPVITVTETTDSTDIARVLRTYRIKRVPVVRDGRIVGIVSRADLLRAFDGQPATAPAAPKREGFLTEVVDAIHDHFVQGERPETGRAHPATEPAHDAEKVSASDFRSIAAAHWNARARHAEAEHEAERAKRRARVKDLVEHHVADASWRELLHRAREAAEAGEKEFLLFRFPAPLCSDAGRAVNVPDPTWPATLRGEAAEIYLRWEHDLKPQGFHLTARVLDFPGGVPGDIGLFLVWGQ